MRHPIVFALLFFSMMVCGCSSPPLTPPPTASSDGAGIGIEVKVRPSFPWGYPFDPLNATVVYFVKVDDDRKPLDDVIYKSNYSKDGRVYLLNIEPGRYVAVAARTPPGSFMAQNYQIFFPKQLIEQTEVSLASGHVTYAGGYVLDTSSGVCEGEADDAQLRYAEKIAPGASKCHFLGMMALNSSVKSQTWQPGPQMEQRNGTYFPVAPSGSNPSMGGGWHTTYQAVNWYFRGSPHDSTRPHSNKGDFKVKASDDLKGAGWSFEPE